MELQRENERLRAEIDNLRTNKKYIEELARYVDSKMQTIAETTGTIDSLKVAILAALNIAHELLEQKGHENSGSQAISRRLQTMQEKIDIALNQGN